MRRASRQAEPGSSFELYARAMLDHWLGKTATVEFEREDGYRDVSRIDTYFAPPSKWPRMEREALRLVRGRVLDVGCGPGRHALSLQKKGFDVVGIDASPTQVALARIRGVLQVYPASVLAGSAGDHAKGRAADRSQSDPGHMVRGSPALREVEHPPEATARAHHLAGAIQRPGRRLVRPAPRLPGRLRGPRARHAIGTRAHNLGRRIHSGRLHRRRRATLRTSKGKRDAARKLLPPTAS